jgi:hypothetical protein
MIYRHGDLILQQRTQLPKKLLSWHRHRSIVLAEGETSGHKHVVNAATPILFVHQNNKQFIELETYGALTHEEHKEITLPPGIYEITKEQEYDYINSQTLNAID